jgi:hydroxymethylpyrimidine pyrophosphatase-like HAD family hydrolase
MQSVSGCIRLLAIDLDGTLIGPGNRIDERDLAAVGRLCAAGVVVVPATARWYQAAMRPFERAGLPVRGAIAAGGADVRGPEGEQLALMPLPEAFVDFVAEIADELDWHATVATPEGALRRGPHPGPDIRLPPWLEVVPRFGSRRPAPAVSVLLELPADHPAVDTVRRWHGVSVLRARTSDGTVFLTCTAAGADKGTGLRALRERLGIARSETAAVGDSEVDLPMFAEAGLAIAVANADPEVLERADWVTAPGGAGGIAEAAERLREAGRLPG